VKLPRSAVVVFGYKRARHLERCLDSIKAAPRAGWDSVHIFIDGPKNSEEAKEVGEVRLVAERFSSEIENLFIHMSEYNKGLSESIVSALDEISTQYEYFCVLEDDLEVHPLFFNFLQTWLKQDLNELNIGSVTGYAYVKPLFKFNRTNFLIRRHCSWGWGTTSTLWREVDWDLFRNRNLKLSWRIWLMGPDMLAMARSQERGSIDSWSIRFDAFMADKGRTCVMPSASLVTNNGWDGSGTHSEHRVPTSATLFRPQSPDYETGLAARSAAIDLQIWLVHTLAYKIMKRAMFRLTSKFSADRLLGG